jgi:hypothetical protein
MANYYFMDRVRASASIWRIDRREARRLAGDSPTADAVNTWMSQALDSASIQACVRAVSRASFEVRHLEADDIAELCQLREIGADCQADNLVEAIDHLLYRWMRECPHRVADLHA